MLTTKKAWQKQGRNNAAWSASDPDANGVETPALEEPGTRFRNLCHTNDVIYSQRVSVKLLSSVGGKVRTYLEHKLVSPAGFTCEFGMPSASSLTRSLG